MKVILLQDVPRTGKKNQVLNVSDGFARNYLLPRGLAKTNSQGRPVRITVIVAVLMYVFSRKKAG